MANGRYELVKLEVSGGYGRDVVPRAEVKVSCPDGRIQTRVSREGVGMTDCAIRAVNLIIGKAFYMPTFNLTAKATVKNQGSSVPGVCALTLRDGSTRVMGQAEDFEMVNAAVLAHLDGINRLISQGCLPLVLMI